MNKENTTLVWKDRQRVITTILQSQAPEAVQAPPTAHLSQASPNGRKTPNTSFSEDFRQYYPKILVEYFNLRSVSIPTHPYINPSTHPPSRPSLRTFTQALRDRAVPFFPSFPAYLWNVALSYFSIA